MNRIVLFLVLIFVINSCESFYIDSSISCSECYTERFDSASLKIFLTQDDMDSVFLEVYKDNPQTGEFIWGGFVEEEIVDYVYVKVNEKYSAQAYYFSDKDSLLAVDGNKMRRVFVTDYCSEDCYAVVNNEIDLTIKYWD